MDAEPERDDVLEWLIEAWNDLATERPIGMSVGYIPWSRIQFWCEWNELEHDVSQLVIRVIRHVDAKRMDEREAGERLDRLRQGRGS